MQSKLSRRRIGPGTRAALASLAALAGLAAGCDVAAANDARVVVSVDGAPRLELARAELDAPLDLAQALGIALADVRRVEIRDDGAHPLRVVEPAARHPRRTLAAFPTDAGIGAGFVDPVLGKLPERLAGLPSVARADVRAIEITLRDATAGSDARAASDVAAGSIAIAAGGATLATLTADDVAALPAQSPMEALGLGAGMQTQSGVAIGELVAAHADLARVERVRLVCADGALELAAAELAPGGARAALIHRNRRGAWRLKVWAPAAAASDASVDSGRPRVVAEGRGLERIELVLAPDAGG